MLENRLMLSSIIDSPSSEFLLFVTQRLHSAEMLEMHQRTREAVDSIVQHYQVACCDK